MNVKSLFHVATAAGLSLAVFAAQAALPDEYALNQNLATTAVSAGVHFADRASERVAQLDEYQRNQLPAADGAQHLARAQVRAEAVQARKLGLIGEGEVATPVASQAQLQQIRQAGLDAAQHQVAAR